MLLLLMQDNGLAWIPIIFSSGPVNGWDPFVSPRLKVGARERPARHLAALLQQVRDAQELGRGVMIPQITSHTGHDSFSEVGASQHPFACCNGPTAFQQARRP